jgi:hypothetical protein
MSQAEYDAMMRTGMVQEGAGGVAYVAYPADPAAYGNQAAPSSVYVEFDVPVSSVVPTAGGWAKIPGPTSFDARLAARKGLPAPQFPAATNVEVVARK